MWDGGQREGSGMGGFPVIKSLQHQVGGWGEEHGLFELDSGSDVAYVSVVSPLLGSQPPAPTLPPPSGASRRCSFLLLNLSFPALSVTFWMKNGRRVWLTNLFLKVPALWSQKSSLVEKFHCIFCKYIKISQAIPSPNDGLLHLWDRV